MHAMHDSNSAIPGNMETKINNNNNNNIMHSTSRRRNCNTFIVVNVNHNTI